MLSASFCSHLLFYINRIFQRIARGNCIKFSIKNWLFFIQQTLYNSNTHGKLKIVRVIECSSNKKLLYFCKFFHIWLIQHDSIYSQSALFGPIPIPLSLKKSLKLSFKKNSGNFCKVFKIHLEIQRNVDFTSLSIFLAIPQKLEIPQC